MGNIAQSSHGIAEVNERVAQSSLVVAYISSDIDDINQQSAQIGLGAVQVLTSGQQFACLAEQLQALVARFKV